MGLWNSIKNAAKSVGKFVKKNWKTILGITAAVAIPFVAPMIGGALAGSAFLASVAPGVASFLGGSFGSALIGSALGGGTAALTGQNPLLGAALGGVGGYAGAAMGLGNMASNFLGFGGTAGAGASAGLSAAAAPAASTAALPSAGLINIGGVTATAGGVPVGAASVGAAAGGGGLTGTLGSLATKLATNPQSIGALGQLAMVMFNKDMTELTPEERAQLNEVANQASTNQALFNYSVEEARRVIQSGSPNPEQAYANARFAADSQFDEQMRGMPVGLQEAADRKATIESSKLGLQNVAVDYAGAIDRRRAGLQMMPTEAPTGYNQLAMPTYNSVYERQNSWNEQLGKALGGLTGSLA